VPSLLTFHKTYVIEIFFVDCSSIVLLIIYLNWSVRLLESDNVTQAETRQNFVTSINSTHFPPSDFTPNIVLHFPVLHFQSKLTNYLNCSILRPRYQIMVKFSNTL